MPCPECNGEQMVGHPAGWLAIRHTVQCRLRAHEDATQVADQDRLRGRIRIDRPTTDTERTLLAALGIDTTAIQTTAVRRLTSSILQRTWKDPA